MRVFQVLFFLLLRFFINRPRCAYHSASRRAWISLFLLVCVRGAGAAGSTRGSSTRVFKYFGSRPDLCEFVSHKSKVTRFLVLWWQPHTHHMMLLLHIYIHIHSISFTVRLDIRHHHNQHYAYACASNGKYTREEIIQFYLSHLSSIHVTKR